MQSRTLNKPRHFFAVGKVHKKWGSCWTNRKFVELRVNTFNNLWLQTERDLLRQLCTCNIRLILYCFHWPHEIKTDPIFFLKTQSYCARFRKVHIVRNKKRENVLSHFFLVPEMFFSFMFCIWISGKTYWDESLFYSDQTLFAVKKYIYIYINHEKDKGTRL